MYLQTKPAPGIGDGGRREGKDQVFKRRSESSTGKHDGGCGEETAEESRENQMMGSAICGNGKWGIAGRNRGNHS